MKSTQFHLNCYITFTTWFNVPKPRPKPAILYVHGEIIEVQHEVAYSLKLNSYSNASVFYRFVACAFPFFEVKSVLPIDRYQNATSKAISLHELKKVQLQERYTLVTQDSIGHLKTLCMSVLSLVVALESEWKRYSSQSDKKKKKKKKKR